MHFSKKKIFFFVVQLMVNRTQIFQTALKNRTSNSFQTYQKRSNFQSGHSEMNPTQLPKSEKNLNPSSPPKSNNEHTTKPYKHFKPCLKLQNHKLGSTQNQCILFDLGAPQCGDQVKQDEMTNCIFQQVVRCIIEYNRPITLIKVQILQKIKIPRIFFGLRILRSLNE